MAEKLQRLIGLDSSVLIEYFRKSKKEKAFFFQSAQKEWEGFVVSVIVHHDVYKGATKEQIRVWDNLFDDFVLVPYTVSIDVKCLQIHSPLKKIRKSIQLQDLVMATTSSSLNIPLATINEKHFDQVHGLHLITPSSFLS